MEQERAFKGIWIPKEIWLSKDLTMQEKIMLVEIDSLDNEDGCFATNQYLADFFDISKTRVSIVLNNLVEKGYLKSKIIYKEGTKQILNRVLNICRPPYPTNVKEGYITKVKDPIQQMLKDNNINYNKDINNTDEIKEKNIKKEKFVKPTKEEIKQYCIERRNDVDADMFFDFYESKDWKVGKNNMKDWKACVRTWERRKKENYTTRQDKGGNVFFDILREEGKMK